MKYWLYVFLLLSFTLNADPGSILEIQEGDGSIKVSVTINNINIDGGNLYLAIFNSAESQKNEDPYVGAIIKAEASSITVHFMLDPGDYVASAFQDTNGNGVLDTNFLGIPREPVGLSNYSGRGRPGNFNRLKTAIDNQNNKLVVNMTSI